MIDDTQQASLTPGQQRRADMFDQHIASNFPDWLSQGMTDRQKARYVGGLGKPHRMAGGLAKMGLMRNDFGYGAGEDALNKYVTGELGAAQTAGQPTEAQINLRRSEAPTMTAAGQYARNRLASPTLNDQDTPMLSQIASYAKERLGSGLTPEEMASLRAPQIEAVESQAREGQRELANRLAASGAAPGSGLAEVEAGRLERARAGGRAGIERDLVTRALQRKGEMEQLAANVGGQEAARRGDLERMALGVGGQEEGARQFDVGSANERLARLEALQSALAGMGEGRREYDLGFGESRRQARLSRELYRQALRRAEPTGLEQANSIVGGIAGGLGG